MYIISYLVISALIAVIAVKDFNDVTEKKSFLWSMVAYFVFLFCWPIVFIWVLFNIIINRLKN